MQTPSAAGAKAATAAAEARAARREALDRRLCELLARRPAWTAAGGVLATGWPGVDLARGAIHEWIGVSSDSPPCALLAHLAWRALEDRAERCDGDPGRVLWIGRRVFPYPRSLVGDFELAFADGELELVPLARERLPRDPLRLLAASLHVDVERAASRLWAIDSALRCAAVTAVVGDASGFDMAATRRLQLAAEAEGGIALLARPPREEPVLSAAATRWRVRRARSRADARPRWTLELLRKKSTLCRASSH